MASSPFHLLFSSSGESRDGPGVNRCVRLLQGCGGEEASAGKGGEAR